MTNFPVANKELSLLYNRTKQISETTEGRSDGNSGGRSGFRYLSSQYLADSSLSDDVSASAFFGTRGAINFGSGGNASGNEPNQSQDVVDVTPAGKIFPSAFSEIFCLFFGCYCYTP
jgi:hypothetical protein